MSRRPAPLPPGLGDVFSTRDARAAGVTVRRLRAADLEGPFRGVRTIRVVDGPPHIATTEAEPFARDRRARDGVLARARAYRQVMMPHAFFAGRTAAVIW